MTTSVQSAGQPQGAVSPERSGGVGPVLAYAAVAAGVTFLGVVLVRWLASPEVGRAVGWAAGVAYAIQVVAFVALWGMRNRGAWFFAAWGGGTILRLGAVGAAGLWLARSEAFPPAPLLLGLAGFLFLLLLLEPLFFRAGIR